jgi:hypothetical protein
MSLRLTKGDENRAGRFKKMGDGRERRETFYVQRD